MTSIRSKLFQFVIRNRNYFQFKFRRTPEITWDTSVTELRLKTEKASTMFGKLSKDILLRELDIDGMYGEKLCLSGEDIGKIILYFHGGGYVIGSAKGHRIHVSKIVKLSGIPALTFDYSLGPEKPFPAGLNDSIKAYMYLLEKGYQPENIIFMGDSAGGGLALATLLELKEKLLPLPKAAIVLSPWTDLKNTGDSLTKNEKVDFLTWRESWTIFSDYYRGGESPDNPLVSPLYGDLRGLPPLKIFVGGDELLLDDSVRFAQKAKEAGVEVSLVTGKGMFHCYPVCAPLFPEATAAMSELVTFLQAQLEVNKVPDDVL